MLRDRLTTSAVLIAASLLLFYLDTKYSRPGLEGLWLLPLLLFFALGTAFDLATMLRGSRRAIDRKWVFVATAVIAASPCGPKLWPVFGHEYPANCPIGTLGWVVGAVVLAIFVFLFREILRYREGRGRVLERTLGGVFASVYVGVPMALLGVIRSLDGADNGVETSQFTAWGLAALITTIAVTKSADVGAYFTGKAIGRHKMIPHLSPGKTWEGAAGGIAMAVAVSYACGAWLFPAAGEPLVPSPWWGPAVFGVICAISGMIGDLAESLVKRESGVKDSGTWLPGLGGVWDVTDSLIGAVMPAWVLLATGMVGF